MGRTRTRLMRDLFEYFDLPEELFKHIFGNLYARDVLTQRERELCAVAGLCVLNRTNELRSHIIAALRAGATKEDVAEVILQMSTYGGMPVCIEGLALPEAGARESRFEIDGIVPALSGEPGNHNF